MAEGKDADSQNFLERARACLQRAGIGDIIPRHAGMLLFLSEKLDGFAENEQPEENESRKELEQRWHRVHDAIENNSDQLAGMRGAFEWAYQSAADQSGQPVFLHVPEAYAGSTSMPLVVILHGLGGSHLGGGVPECGERCIQVAVNGRGSPFYRGLGELDVLEATDFVMAHYNIDPTRVYLYGGSMGGWGVMRMATRYPERWAAAVVFCGWAYGLELGNLSNLPLQIHHGDDDRAVPVDHMRLAVQELKALACPADYYEYPGVGHAVAPHAATRKPLDFLLRHSQHVDVAEPAASRHTVRPPHTGGFFHIFDGQPIHFSIPVDTQDNEELDSVVSRLRHSADMVTTMPHGQIPLLDDHCASLSSVDGHVVLVGSPTENALVEELLDHVPVSVAGDRLMIEGVGDYPMDSTGLSLFCLNPHHEEKRVLWLLNPRPRSFPLMPLFTFWSWVSYHPDMVIHDVSGEEPVLLAAANLDSSGNRCDDRASGSLPDSVGAVCEVRTLAARTWVEHFDADYAIILAPERFGGSAKTGALTLSSLQAMTPAGMQPLVRADLSQEASAHLRDVLAGSEDLQLLGREGEGSPDGKQSFVFCETLIEVLGCNLKYDFPVGTLYRTGVDVHDLLEAMAGPCHGTGKMIDNGH